MEIPRLGRKMPLSEMFLMRCDNCKLVFNDRHVMCSKCGRTLISEKTSVHANLGKKGVSSFVYELESGIRIKVKANNSFPLDKGAYYSAKAQK